MDLKAGLADQSVPFAAWTTATGAPVTVTSATAGLSLWYRRGVAGAKVAITPIGDLATLETAHTDKAILVVEGAEHRLDLPDAACAAGALTVSWGGTATGITIDGGTANLLGQANTATDVMHWLGTAAHAATVNGVPVVQLHNSAGTGGINAPANFEDLHIADTAGTIDLGAVLGTDLFETVAGQIANGIDQFFDVTTPVGTLNLMPANVTKISGDTTAADNLEAAFDGTGYAFPNSSFNVGSIMGSALAAKVLAARNYAYRDDATLVLDLTGTDTDIERGTALVAAIAAVQLLTPGGAAISSTNRARLLIPPGRYDVAANEPAITASGVDLIALVPEMGGQRGYTDTDAIGCFRPPGTLVYTTVADKHTLKQSAADVRLSGFGLAQLGTGHTTLASALYVTVDANDESQYDSMYLWLTEVEQSSYKPTIFAKHVGGTWTNCIANSCGWRINYGVTGAQFRGTFIDCEGGWGAFIGDHYTDDDTSKATGCRCIRCHAIGGDASAPGGYGFGGCTSDGTAIDATCYFEDCSAGKNSFGLGEPCAGTFVRCRGGQLCFGSTSSSDCEGFFSGYAVDCIGGLRSFGGSNTSNVGQLTGTLVRCTCIGNQTPVRLTGATVDSCVFTQAGTNKDMFTLLDSNSRISRSVLSANGSGKSINAASALTFAGRGNTLPQGLGTNVTNTLVDVDLTAATIADAVADEPLADHTTAGSAGKTLADVLVDTAEIGAAGAGLSAIPKTGFKLASDGLDSIATTAPAGVASNFREMLVQVWRRFFKKSTLTATQLKTYDDAGTGVLTTQTVSDDNTTQTQGTSS